MDKISVIVPAYNAEKTIERCLHSIQKQTYSDLEIIVVNDGSTDNTLEKLQLLSIGDKRVKILDIPNGGVSHARNVGIDYASGDYLTFVDADDYIDEIMYEKLIGVIKKYNVKIAHCSYKNVSEDGVVLSIVGDNKKFVKQSHDEAIECLLTGKLFTGGLWNKIYDKSLFSNVKLDENIKFKEDLLLNYMLFDKVDSSVYIDDAFYNYVAVDTSSTHSNNGIIPAEQSVYVSRKIVEMSKNKDYEIIAQNSYCQNMLGLYRGYILYNINTQEKKKLLAEIQICKSNGCYPLKKDKLLIFIYKYLPHIFCFTYKKIYYIYDKIRVKKLDPEQ